MPRNASGENDLIKSRVCCKLESDTDRSFFYRPERDLAHYLVGNYRQLGAAMSYQRQIGPHEVRVDDDDLMTIVFQGPLDAQQMQEILREHDGKLAADGDLFSISDLRGLTAVAPGARHALGARSKNLPGYCVAYMVPHFQAKLILEVLLRTANLLLKVKVHYRFFDAVEPAREWLLEMRRSRR